MEIKGIDISKWNENIDWEKVKKDQIKFVMIRAGYGSKFEEDVFFKENIKSCEEAGVDYGIYLYSYATNMDEAKEEVEGYIRAIKKYKPTMPVVIDSEDADGWRKKNGNPSIALMSDMLIYQLKELEKAGYYPMWYTMLNWAKDMIKERDELKNYDLWLAHWSKKMGDPGMPVSIWQYTDKGPKYGSGIDTTDMNIAFKDYPSLFSKAREALKQ